ncbi:hypothetical protein DXG01_009393 [Tephrocybe rancida]|nr:hypothetical protein DXG01_009393 [Tephrocybe rancida]
MLSFSYLPSDSEFAKEMRIPEEGWQQVRIEENVGAMVASQLPPLVPAAPERVNGEESDLQAVWQHAVATDIAPQSSLSPYVPLRRSKRKHSHLAPSSPPPNKKRKQHATLKSPQVLKLCRPPASPRAIPLPEVPRPRIQPGTPLPQTCTTPLFLPGPESPRNVHLSATSAGSISPNSVSSPVRGEVPIGVGFSKGNSHNIVDGGRLGVSYPTSANPHLLHPQPNGPIEEETAENAWGELEGMSLEEVRDVFLRKFDAMSKVQFETFIRRVRDLQEPAGRQLAQLENLTWRWRAAVASAQYRAVVEHRRFLEVVFDRYMLQMRAGLVRGEVAAGLRALPAGLPLVRHHFEEASRSLEDAVVMDVQTASWQFSSQNARLFEGSFYIPSDEEILRHLFNPHELNPPSPGQAAREGDDWSDDLEALYGPSSQSECQWEEGEAGPSEW